MATQAAQKDDAIKKLRTQLRDSRKKGPLRQRLEIVAKKGAPAYSGGLAIGYVEEMYGPERGAQVTAAMGIGGLAALFMLNPAEGSVVEVLLAGATASGMATMAREHGATLGRYGRVKRAQAENARDTANTAPAEIDDATSETISEQEFANDSERVTG